MLGETINGYRITEQIGEGGMGVVYVATHEVMGRKAVVKVLRPRLLDNQEMVQRFLNEATAAATIRHPGIVDVMNVGRHSDGQVFILMDHLEGENLGERIKRAGKLGSREALLLVRQVASALAAAHKQGIVHRDLKPDNIFLVKDSEVPGGERTKLLDFGIAKLTEEGGESATGMTRTGALMGTPLYMSPEQCRGAGKVDHRTDLYALGCILFELLCGRPPFLGQGVGDLISSHMKDPVPSPRSFNADIREPVAELIQRLLAKSPADRFANAQDLINAIDQLTDGAFTTDPGLAATTPSGAVDPLSSTMASADTTLGGTAAEITTAEPDSRSAMVYGVAGVGVLALAAVVFLATRSGGGSDSGTSGTARPAATDAAVKQEPKVARKVDAGPPPLNQWVKIAPPSQQVRLGVADDAKHAGESFRASLNVTAPSYSYEIHQHEVTWQEFRPWLDAQKGKHKLTPVKWLPKGAKRNLLPVTGVGWKTAYAFCKSLGASLPTEEEWEYAARGPSRRAFPWGPQRLDLERTHAFAGAKARLVAVKSRDQDRTPNGIWDLAGNAQEWTADPWRASKPGVNEQWAQAEGMTFRAIRGLPLNKVPPKRLPTSGAAYREVLCAAGPCVKHTAAIVPYVGFRCARRRP